LPRTLVDIDKRLSGVEYSYEILVVNDGSKDKTAEITRRLEGKIKNLKLIDNDVNKGKGGVVRQGMLLAKGKIRLFTDADNSTSIDQFNNMLPYFSARGGYPSSVAEPLAYSAVVADSATKAGRRTGAAGGSEGYDVVIGSRAIKGSRLEPPQPIYRQIPGKIGNLIIQLLLLPGIWDTQCGFKAFTALAAEKVFTQSKIAGWGFDVEVLALAKKLGYRIKEMPVVWVNDPFSHLGASAYLKTLWETFKIRWWLSTGKYEILNPKS